MQLILTSPPYNIGKSYEKTKKLETYLTSQGKIIAEAARVLSNDGSICWQVGNYIQNGEVFPLDILLYPLFKAAGLKLRSRIIWHYRHGLHASRRFSGRHETILWFTKSDQYYFDLDPLRVPQRYPNKKHYRGTKLGEVSSNPLGKNPGDVWIIPNVKSNHVEKTAHPCQFPVELAERVVLSMSRSGDTVLDPYGGSGTTVLAAVLNKRRGIMAETSSEYVKIANARLDEAERGELRTRPISRPIFEP